MGTKIEGGRLPKRSSCASKVDAVVSEARSDQLRSSKLADIRAEFRAIAEKLKVEPVFPKVFCFGSSERSIVLQASPDEYKRRELTELVLGALVRTRHPTDSDAASDAIACVSQR